MLCTDAPLLLSDPVIDEGFYKVQGFRRILRGSDIQVKVAIPNMTICHHSCSVSFQPLSHVLNQCIEVAQGQGHIILVAIPIMHQGLCTTLTQTPNVMNLSSICCHGTILSLSFILCVL